MVAALALAPGASAWAWPVDGPVLRPFVAEGDPYAGGQHRGIDIGAPTGADVRSAATGVASFVGRLPHQGLCLTVRTSDGYSVTLVHLGSIGVTTGTPVSEGDVVGTIGPSGDVEGTEPYVYLGIRLTADPNGYLDPLGLLPPRHAPEAPPVSQPPAPAAQPAPPAVRAQPPRSAPTPAKRTRTTRTAPVPSARPPAARPTVLETASAPRARGEHEPVVHPREAPRGAPPRGLTAWRHPATSTVTPYARGHVPPSEVGDQPAQVTVDSRARVEPAPPGAGGERSSRRLLLVAMAFTALSLLTVGLARAVLPWASPPPPVPPRPLRKMSMTLPAPEESLPEPPTTAHSRSRRLALREWPAASRTCRRLRGSVRHHGQVPPAVRRLRADGERNRRARDAGHGRRRQRGAVST
jgi:hypothetical protein